MQLYILLGYLGSGKTTLALHMRRTFSHKKTAVIVNDFGDGDVDGKLFGDENTFSITGGSIFCNCKSHLFLQALEKVCTLNPEVVIVEASGMANPYTMLDIIELAIKRGCEIELRAVITVVDASLFERYLTAVHMVKMQVAAADAVVINKCDSASSDTVERVRTLIGQINETAAVMTAVHAEFDVSSVRNTGKKCLPQNVIDVFVQRFRIQLSGVPLTVIEKFSQDVSTYAHRIKGTVNIGGKSFIYEYINGESKLTEVETGGETFLIVLAVSPCDLRQAIIDHLSAGMTLMQ